MLITIMYCTQNVAPICTRPWGVVFKLTLLRRHRRRRRCHRRASRPSHHLNLVTPPIMSAWKQRLAELLRPRASHAAKPFVECCQAELRLRHCRRALQHPGCVADDRRLPHGL
eukprot:COSAG02_NODE_34475_length_483_cov_1.674479_1_plen_112_part_10